MHCETWEARVTAVSEMCPSPWYFTFLSALFFECCGLLNKNLFLQSVEQWRLILSSVWMDVPWANVFCPSVDVHILCHAKQTKSLVPFRSSEGCSKKKKSGLLLPSLGKPLNFCVMSPNLHTCLVAKFNSVISLFSYCKCYLVAYSYILGGVLRCQSDILCYKLGHFY